MRVKERLLLDRIALHAADVAPRHHEASVVVESHFADADRPRWQRTAMAARITTQPAIRERFVQVALTRFVRQQLSQCRHGTCPLYDLGTDVETVGSGGRHAPISAQPVPIRGCACSYYRQRSGLSAAG